MRKDSPTTIFYTRNMTKPNFNSEPQGIPSTDSLLGKNIGPEISTLRELNWWEVQQLERQGCAASDWSLVKIDPLCSLSSLRNVEFEGNCNIGAVGETIRSGSLISNARLENCNIADGVRIRNIGGCIRNAIVGKDACIENVGRIEYEAETLCGLGTAVSVLDETGSRQVIIYPGLSTQSALLMARDPRLAEDTMRAQTMEHCEEFNVLPVIGDEAVVRDCGTLRNVFVDREVTVEGASRLSDGMIINNAAPGRPLAYVGHGVDAAGFIIEDGRVDSGALLRNVYVGQGAVIEKGFTAHDSLFFANCSMENGEACALFAGPYTVSMHKGSLLIGAQTSFMNAGSATNQSNHMYKLGPVHWGILERGVKTSSNSYLMHGAAIGAFSLLMGDHKTHPDSREFPFSYLFGDEKGATVVVPAMMLRSCGLMRDEMKWPTRDRRLKRKIENNDRIVFEVLNPFTISRILKALETIEELLHLQADDDRFIRYKGMKFSKASLERARHIYSLAVYKYLHSKLPEGRFPEGSLQASKPETTEWIDLGGLIMTRETLEEAKKAESVREREEIFKRAYESYPELEIDWILSTFTDDWRVDPERIRIMAEDFDRLVEDDRALYRESLQAESDMLKL